MRARRLHPEMTMFMCLLTQQRRRTDFAPSWDYPQVVNDSMAQHLTALTHLLLYECYAVWLAWAPGPDRELQTAEMLPLGCIGVSAPVLPRIMRRYFREVVMTRAHCMFRPRLDYSILLSSLADLGGPLPFRAQVRHDTSPPFPKIPHT